MNIPKPTVGRILEIALVDSERGTTIHRPGIVVAAGMGGEDGVNVQVFLDGANDRGVQLGGVEFDKRGDRTVTAATPLTSWLTSVHHHVDGIVPEGEIATWRYPPHSTEKIEVSR